MKKLTAALFFAIGLLAADAVAQPAPPPGVKQVGAVAPGNCVQWNGTNKIQDAGSPCGSGGGGGVSQFGAVTAGHMTRWNGTNLIEDAGGTFAQLFQAQGVLASQLPQFLGGDVTSPTAGSIVLNIGNQKVTYAKIQNVGAISLLGNDTGSPATMQELTPTAVKTLLGIDFTDISGRATFAQIPQGGANTTACNPTGGTADFQACSTTTMKTMLAYSYGDLPAVANNTLLSNITGSSNPPAANTAPAFLDSAFCNTVGYIIARTTGGWVCSNDIPAPITWFGAVGNNSTDNCSVLTTAFASGAKRFYVPAGIYRHSCGFTIPDYVTIEGANPGASIFMATFGTGDVWTLGIDSELLRIGLNATAPRTTGYTVKMTGNNGKLNTVEIQNYFKGIGQIGAATNNLIVQPKLIHVTLFTPATGTGSLCIEVTNFSSPIWDDVVCNGPTLPATQPERGITIGYGDTLIASNIHVVAHGYSEINPPSGGFAGAVQFSNFLFDSPNANGKPTFQIAPVSTASVINCKFTTGSFSNALGTSAAGLLIDGGNGGVSNCKFLNTDAAHNTDVGYRIQGANAIAIQVIGGAAPGNVQGVFLNNQGSATILGVNFRASGGYSANSNCDVGFAGSSSGGNTIIKNNLMTAGLPCGTVFNGSSATTNVIKDNVGYNPVGGSNANITPGASPYTYRASATPETVYIKGGTLTSVVLNGGISVATQANNNQAIVVELGPNETVTVTYSSVPTMSKYVH